MLAIFVSPSSMLLASQAAPRLKHCFEPDAKVGNIRVTVNTSGKPKRHGSYISMIPM